MSKRRKRRKNQSNNTETALIREKIAEKTARTITILLSVLIIGLLIFVFRIGESIYPAWMIERRKPIIGIVFSIILVIVLASPLIVEANSNPRPLTGPGDRPSGSGWQ